MTYLTLEWVFGEHGVERSVYIPSTERQKGHAEFQTLLSVSADRLALAKEWQAKYEALKAAQPKKPERKLREVRVRGGGFTHAVTLDGKEFVFNNANGSKRKYMTLSDMAIYHSAVSWTDDVLAQCLALKSDPYEPVETVEEVLRDAMRACYLSGGATIAEMVSKYATRIRAACAAEAAR